MKIVLLLLLLPVISKAQTAPDRTVPSYVSKKLAKQVFKYIDENTEAANAGKTYAIEQMAAFYDNQHLDRFDRSYNWLYSEDVAVQWLRRGIKAGIANCGFKLGMFFTNRRRGNPGYADSAKYYFEFAADRGHVDGMMFLAKEYDFRDVHAIYWYRQAAAKGNTQAAQEVADIIAATDEPFLKGYQAYKSGNNDLAIQLWKIDYKVNKNPNAAFNMGALYQQKRNTVDNSNASFWFANACDLGMVEGCMMAAKMEDDYGFRGRAMEFWQKAVQLGNTEAAGYINKTNADIAGEQARRDAYWQAYNKKINDAINNGTYVNPNAVNSTANPKINYYAIPKKTAAENDQLMYEKMRQEQNQREKAYREKWGN